MPLASFTSLRFPAILSATLCCTILLQAQTQMPACHPSPKATQQVAPKDLPPPQKLTGIGNLHFPISSKNPETQQWFDQGINLVYDFWDYEADRAFEQAIRTDPNCAICHWALADSLGIHNSETQGYAHEELMQAIALRNKADKREKMYIDMAEASAETKAKDKNGKAKSGQSGDEQATAILRQIVKKFPSDINARLMLSEDVSEGYDRETGKAKPGTVESMAILQGILKEKPDDSAANHLWIHAVEASPHPEQALHSAQILGELTPNSGHMTHMPGHIFYRVGDYQRAQVAFDLSTSVDEAYMRSQHVSADDDWNYVHNLMYSVANLLEEGQIAKAGEVSAKLIHARGTRAATLYPWSTRDSISRLNPELPVALRNGDWPRVQTLLADAHPPVTLPNLEALATALTTFAKGMDSISQKNLDAAQQHSTELDAQLWRISQQLDQQKAAEKEADKAKDAASSATPANQPAPTDQNLETMLKNLAIMSLELRGAILIPNGKVPEAEALFAQARKAEFDLGYREPPAFVQPVAELEAEYLTAARRTAEAEKAWKQALADRPNSGYPLYGLAILAEQSADANKTTAAYSQFLNAWKTADPQLPQIQHAQQWMMAHPDKALASSAASAAPQTR